MASFGFASGLGLAQRRTGSAAAPVPASIITALTILGAAVLPDGADAAVPNGWVAKADFPDDGSSTFDPAKIAIVVQDPGYDASGNLLGAGLGGPVRTIFGTQIVRRQYPNNAQRLNSTSGGTRSVYFALDDDIYQGSTIASASAAAGYYGPAGAGSVAGIVNGSTLAYPKPLFAWVNTQHERVNAASYDVEAVAYHRHAMNGRQVAAVQFSAVDAQSTPNQSAAVTASSTSLSAIQTLGSIAEVFRATISLASLTQGDLCRANAKVYPWLGDATAVLDLVAGGVSVSGALATMNPQTPLRFLCDKTGSYGGGAAWVRPGASGGTVGSSSTPFATIGAAVAALKIWNNSNKGHNNHSGSTVYLMETAAGAGAVHSIDATSATAAGLCWTDIRKDPGASGPVTAQLDSNAGVASLLRWQVPITNAGFFMVGDGSGSAMMALEGMTLTYTASTIAPINYQTAFTFFKNVTLAGGDAVASPFYGYSSLKMLTRCVGVVFTDMVTLNSSTTCLLQPYTLIGCRFANASVTDSGWVASWDSCDGAVIANCEFLKMQQTAGIVTGSMTAGYSRGAAIVQNIFERTITPSSRSWGVGADDGVQAFANVVEFYNTIPGGGASGASIARTNRAYADVAGAVGVSKRMMSRFNLWYDYNVKSDTFTSKTTVSGRTGNWAVRYSVGNRGNVAVLGADDGSTAPDASGGNWLGEVWPADSKPSGAAIGFTVNGAGAAGAGAGTYTLTGASNDAYGRVAGPGSSHVTLNGAAVSLAGLKYDLAGVARRTDGSGAAGVFERTIG